MGEERSVRRDLVNDLYGINGCLSINQRSIWWKDLNTLDTCLSFAQQWFADCVKCKLGDGKRLRFWTDLWCCQWSLAELYPQLYEVSINKSGCVAEFGLWQQGGWIWRLRWCNELSEEEQQIAELLYNTLLPISPVMNVCDRLVWQLDNSVYKVKTVYKSLLQKSGEAVVEDATLKALKKVWRTKAPSKILVHVWRTLLNRIPTKEALIRRNITLQEGGTDCVLCGNEMETVDTCFSLVMSHSSCG